MNIKRRDPRVFSYKICDSCQCPKKSLTTSACVILHSLIKSLVRLRTTKVATLQLFFFQKLFNLQGSPLYFWMDNSWSWQSQLRSKILEWHYLPKSISFRTSQQMSFLFEIILKSHTVGNFLCWRRWKARCSSNEENSSISNRILFSLWIRKF